MNFPYYFSIFGEKIHPHVLMELLAYIQGIALHFILRRHERRLNSPRELHQQIWLMVGAVFGALVGARLLAIWESPECWAQGPELLLLFGGKTVLGGLVGGWVGVEIAKKFLGVRESTGDTWVLPLCLGMAIGRVGCFLTGLSDHTYGIATTLPWAVDFGDGVFRHPTQIYEIFFLLAMFVFFWNQRKQPSVPGIAFRQFMFGYALMRFAIEFLKPTAKLYFSLSAIQVVALAIVVYLAPKLCAHQCSALRQECEH